MPVSARQCQSSSAVSKRAGNSANIYWNQHEDQHYQHPEHRGIFASVADKSDDAALRGDYSRADDQYAVQQDWDGYTPEQHERWRRLYQRQLQLVPGRACDEFIAGLTELHAADAIPHLDQASDTLFKATGWQLVAVPGLIPEHSFFRASGASPLSDHGLAAR
ncbi:hypothetical protein ACFS07_03570 [Undibacterium arcticum]